MPTHPIAVNMPPPFPMPLPMNTSSLSMTSPSLALPQNPMRLPHVPPPSSVITQPIKPQRTEEYWVEERKKLEERGGYNMRDLLGYAIIARENGKLPGTAEMQIGRKTILEPLYDFTARVTPCFALLCI